MVYVFNSQVILNLHMMQNAQNKSRMWFTLSGWVKQTNLHTHGYN